MPALRSRHRRGASRNPILLRLNPDTISNLSPTFTRAGAAYQRASSSIWFDANANVLLKDHYEHDPVSGVDVRTILLQGQRTQLIGRSDESDLWNKSSGITVTTNVAVGLDSILRGDRIAKDAVSDSQSINHVITASAAAGRYTARVHLLADSLDYADVGIYNQTVPNFEAQTLRILRGPGSVTKGTPGRVSGLSTTIPTEVEVVLDAAVTLGDTLQLYIYPGGNVSTSGAGSIILLHGQAEQGSFSTSPIRAAGGVSVIRSADNLSVPINFGPQGMSIFVDFINIGVAQTSLSRVLIIGNTTDAGTVQIIANSSGKFVLYKHNGSSAVTTSAIPMTTPALGDRVRLLGIVYKDGNTRLYQRINSGAVEDSGLTGGSGLPSAWAVNSLWLGSRGGSANAFMAHRDLIIEKGINEDITHFESLVA